MSTDNERGKGGAGGVSAYLMQDSFHPVKKRIVLVEGLGQGK